MNVIDDQAIDKHKVFVRNIKESDVPLITKEFERICNKHFFFFLTIVTPRKMLYVILKVQRMQKILYLNIII